MIDTFSTAIERLLRYTHLSSVSQLPDTEENHSILEFILRPFPGYTLLTLTIERFPTEIIRKHLEFYWQSTIVLIKAMIESGKTGDNNKK